MNAELAESAEERATALNVVSCYESDNNRLDNTLHTA